LHQEQDNSFVVAASFAAQNGVKPQRWFKLQGRTTTLEIFLKTLGAMPEAAPKTPRPSARIIKDAVASISASGAPVTAGRVIEELQKQGYKPAREPVRDALKKAGLTRNVGRPPAARNSPKS
jgi:hypothetical protein